MEGKIIIKAEPDESGDGSTAVSVRAEIQDVDGYGKLLLLDALCTAMEIDQDLVLLWGLTKGALTEHRQETRVDNLSKLQEILKHRGLGDP